MDEEVTPDRFAGVSDDELRAELERRKHEREQARQARLAIREQAFKTWLLAYPARRLIHRCAFKRLETFLITMFVTGFLAQAIFEFSGLTGHVSESTMSGITQAWFFLFLLVGLMGWIGGTLNWRAFRREHPDLYAGD